MAPRPEVGRTIPELDQEREPKDCVNCKGKGYIKRDMDNLGWIKHLCGICDGSGKDYIESAQHIKWLIGIWTMARSNMEEADRKLKEAREAFANREASYASLNTGIVEQLSRMNPGSGPMTFTTEEGAIITYLHGDKFVVLSSVKLNGNWDTVESDEL